MPKSLEKTRKKISKKKGNITALHENSRDSQRLRRALMRDDRLVRVASSRRKNDQPMSESWISLMISYFSHFIVERAAYFQEAIRANDGKALEMATVQNLIRE
jgi:translation machinery-associated protein 16